MHLILRLKMDNLDFKNHGTVGTMLWLLITLKPLSRIISLAVVSSLWLKAC